MKKGTQAPSARLPRTEAEWQRLLHELRIELELQKAELRRARDEAETALEKYKVLQESEKPYASIFHNQHVVMFLVDPETGAILNPNPAACSFYGYSYEQFTSLRISDINALPQQAVSEKMKQANDGETSIFNFQHRLANGEIRDVEVYSGPVTFQGRRLLYSIVHDVSERKRMDENLRKSAHQLAEAQRLAQIGSYEYNPITGKFTGSDELFRIFGYFFSSFESLLEQTHPDDRGIVSKAIQDTLDGQEPYIIHYRLVRPDGTIRFISSHREAETDAAGNVVRMIGTVQDVTERKQLDEKLEILNADLAARAAELEAANIDLDAFASTVTHDLRKPLTVINGYCQIILESCAGSLDDSCTEYLRKIYDTTLLMDQLINALLRFSCPGRSEIVAETVNLSEIAHVIAVELGMSDPQRRVTFAIADKVKGKGDAKLLRVVLENLLGNAWKFTANKAEAVIEFGVTEIIGEPAYFVRDNGPGFDMADAGKLFIPFQRLCGTGTEGHGIGLATVERIIRRHGGRVWAEGEPSKGATFFFTLG